MRHSTILPTSLAVRKGTSSNQHAYPNESFVKGETCANEI